MKQKKVNGRERFREAIRHLKSISKGYPNGRIIKNYLYGRGDKRVVTIGLYSDVVDERGRVSPTPVVLSDEDCKIISKLADETYKTIKTNHIRHKFIMEPMIYMAKTNYDAAWDYVDYTNDPGRLFVLFDLADWKKYARKNFGEFEFPKDYLAKIVKGGQYDGGYAFEYKGNLISLSCHTFQQAKRIATHYKYTEGEKND